VATASRPAPRLRRAYYECRYGQLHLHNAIPAGGGFDELTTVVCLHGQSQTGRAFAPLLPMLGADRSVYALDMPGTGESDVATGIEAAEAGLQVLGEFIDTMRIRSFDVIAWGSGCAIARRVAAERGTAVRRVVLIDDPGAARLPAQPLLLLQAGSTSLTELSAKVVTFLASRQV
jgi:pimeloyl-ACP methyl ester carboxylesterase